MSSSIAVARAERFKLAIQSEKFRQEIAAALPRHVKPERFQRVLLTSVINDNRLLEVEPIKVVKAALKIAPLGLFTDPLLGEAVLVKDGTGEVQVRVMYRGLLKLARQSGEVAAAYAHEVCQNDKVTVSLGTGKALIHEPSIIDRGDVIAYYACVKYRDGEVDFEIMTVPEINKIRDKSDGWKAFRAQRIKDTPWNSSFEEMAKKTVLRRLLKRVPASPDLAEAMRLEEAGDRQEYGESAAERTLPVTVDPGATSYVEVVDQYGETRMIEPAAVEDWIARTAAECTDEELAELAGNNPDLKAIKAIVEAEAAKRKATAAEPQASDDGPPADDFWSGDLVVNAPDAQAWMGAMAKRIKQCDSVAQLAELHAANGKRLATLRKDSPKSADVIDGQIETQRAELLREPADDGQPSLIDD